MTTTGKDADGEEYDRFYGLHPFDCAYFDKFNSIKLPGGSGFFEDTDEARYNLALYVALDWANMKKINAERGHILPLIVTIVFLPGSLRHTTRHQFFLGFSNGAESKYNLDDLLELLVEELLFLYRGHYRKQHPLTKKWYVIRAVAFLFILDLPARCKLCGTMGHKNPFGCLKCMFKAEVYIAGVKSDGNPLYLTS